jgi:hypothetical protein
MYADMPHKGEVCDNYALKVGFPTHGQTFHSAQTVQSCGLRNSDFRPVLPSEAQKSGAKQWNGKPYGAFVAPPWGYPVVPCTWSGLAWIRRCEGPKLRKTVGGREVVTQGVSDDALWNVGSPGSGLHADAMGVIGGCLGSELWASDGPNKIVPVRLLVKGKFFEWERWGKVRPKYYLG